MDIFPIEVKWICPDCNTKANILTHQCNGGGGTPLSTRLSPLPTTA